MSDSSRSGRELSAARVAVVAGGALVAVAAAVLLLSPREQRPDPDPTSPERWFDRETIARGEEFRGGQRALGLLALGIEGAALVGLALWRPGPARRALARISRRPLLGGAAVGAALPLALVLLTTPVALRGHDRAVAVGLSTQSDLAWAGDRLKGAGLGAVGGALGGLGLVGLQRRFGAGWWAPGAGVVVAYAIAVTWAGPVVIAPLFSDFERLESGPARAQVLELSRRAGIEVEDVFVVDASRRSTALNAYVTGIGGTRRVVLYDNLIEDAERSALRSVVAHELAHVANDDIWRGIGFVALTAPFGFALAALLGRALAARTGAEPGSPAAVPAYVAAVAIVAFAVGIGGSALSRQIEAEADRDAIELSGDPRGLIELQRQLAVSNVTDVDPPGWSQALFATHPSTIERIGLALALERAGPERTDAPAR